METIVADFYAGFEGEPEITLKRAAGPNTAVLTAWDGYFSRVMDAIAPGTDGRWHGPVLHYHLGTGWYDGDSLEVEAPEAALFAAQLADLDPAGFDTPTAQFHQSLRAFVQEAAEQKQPLTISYF